MPEPYKNVVFFERSPSSTMVFTKHSYLNKNLSEQEMKLMEALHIKYKWKTTFTFKLDNDVDECLRRIEARQDRDSENNITQAYLSQLNDLYNSEEYVNDHFSSTDDDMKSRLEIIDGRQKTSEDIASYIEARTLEIIS